MHECGLQFRDSCACFRADGQDRRAGKKRSRDEFLGFQTHQSQSIRVHQIAFRQGDHAALHTQQPANFKMFAGLRANGFVRGNHQQNEVDSRSSCKHVFYETLVPRHVHKTKAHAAFFQKSEAKIDGDAAALLFLQAVRMRAGQGFNQRGFAVVNVAGGADDDVSERWV